MFFHYVLFYFRGKSDGHDIDLLISHPVEGKEEGLLHKLLHRLSKYQMTLSGQYHKSTYSGDLLQMNSTSKYLRGSIDHFEKWIGILKINEVVGETESNSNINSEKCGSSDVSSSMDLHSQVIPKSCQSKSSSTNKDSLQNLDSLDKAYTSQLMTLTSALDLSSGDRDWRARRVDLIISPASQYPYALVGWTGSKHFNR